MQIIENAAITAMPPQQISVDVLLEKYAEVGETEVAHIHSRVAPALAENEAPGARKDKIVADFLWAMQNGFVPAGRINSAAGTHRESTLINCFVQPVGDSITGIEKLKPGIYKALAEAAETMRRGGGVGYNFSRLRPMNALVKGTGSKASGPLSYMDVFNESCETVKDGGDRRGAQMGVMFSFHPDIRDFITAKLTKERFSNFNVSVGATDEFMRAVEADGSYELFHEAEPSDELKEKGAYQREDGMWVYEVVQAREIWALIMKCTYAAAEPGVLFMDTINNENNLYYCEVIEATNPCGEQPLPDYGCCCLGSINLAVMVTNPFSDKASFDFEKLKRVVALGVRMLDNTLDITPWPLEEQKKEAHSKRRIGLGFLGLGDALIMLRLRYDSEEGRAMAAKISEVMRDAGYEASIALAKERGPFPLFDAEKYLASGFAKRLPEEIRKRIRKYGIRNSHVISIAPTGTIALAFADNASNGIEPAFSWTYNRNKRMPDNSSMEYAVEDHAYRVYRSIFGDVKPSALPDYFVSAMDMLAEDHMKMVQVVAPFVDAAISKTVNVPVDYPFEDFENLYMLAWKAGLKGITTYRPNNITGAVLSLEGTAAEKDVTTIRLSDSDKRLILKADMVPPVSSMRWESRPELPAGANCWVSDYVETPQGKFAVAVSDKEGVPFEVWVLGSEFPRGIDAVAKSLSSDLRANDKGWVKKKLEMLAKTGSDSFIMAMPPTAEPVMVPGPVAALAKLVLWRFEQLGALDSHEGDTNPVLDALFAPYEPKTGADGTMAWVADIENPSTGDEVVLMLKELEMPDGTRRPYSMWLTGEYPRSADSLCKLLSLDMRIVDTAWIGMKLRKLLNYAEPRGDFFAWVPGSEKKANFSSTVAYIARLVIHRYAMLGILTEEGYPVVDALPEAKLVSIADDKSEVAYKPAMAGKHCKECGNHSVIRKDGCDFCTSCGATGSCG